ncbi:hypothetical protein T4A_362 [Trichinella pseudospiralis]|uniref:Uncharacterized protein n=1 Tax=Trichinella pseudospiralis TaxID=6337 RepID=A0A0V1E6L8_TRIPS|nr:hypothetical protein T4A_362 [Trichinella pseudospiralis]
MVFLTEHVAINRKRFDTASAFQMRQCFANLKFACGDWAFVQMTMNTALTNELLIFANFHSDSFSKPEASFQHLCIV